MSASLVSGSASGCGSCMKKRLDATAVTMPGTSTRWPASGETWAAPWTSWIFAAVAGGGGGGDSVGARGAEQDRDERGEGAAAQGGESRLARRYTCQPDDHTAAFPRCSQRRERPANTGCERCVRS